MEVKLERCSVRSWREEDASALARHANDPTVWRNVRDRFPHPYSGKDVVKEDRVGDVLVFGRLAEERRGGDE